MSRGQRTLFQILFCLYLGGVLYLCFGHFDNTPSVPMEFFGIPTDKLVHFFMFFPFPILAFLAFDQFTSTVKSTLLLTGITFMIGLIMAVGTEIGQAHLTDYRSGDPHDFIADSISLFVSSALVAIIDIRKQKRRGTAAASAK